ncbi:MAG TPA: DUF2892 domain-containing protein [Puia sp.]|nr:DUF2892 domain-containing protein [Puia sp.]
MKQNMGKIDRAVRIIGAAVIIDLFLQHIITGWVAYVLWVVAAIFLLTSLVGTCPLYSLFHFRTNRGNKPGN